MADTVDDDVAAKLRAAESLAADLVAKAEQAKREEAEVASRSDAFEATFVQQAATKVLTAAAPEEPAAAPATRAEPAAKRAAVLLLGSHGDCAPFLDLFDNLRGFVSPCFFCADEQVELVEGRGFEAVPWMSIQRIHEEMPQIWKAMGMQFVRLWYEYFLRPDVTNGMTGKVFAAHERQPFDLILAPGNVDFLTYLLHGKVPVPLVRLDVVEFAPNPHSHPVLDVRHVPSFMMPLLWRAFYGACYQLVKDHGFDAACDAHGRPRRSAAELYRRVIETPQIIGNDFCSRRLDRQIAEGGFCSLGGGDLGQPTYARSVLFTPRWTFRPAEVPKPEARDAVEAFLKAQGGAGLVTFGSMVLQPETVAACLEWIRGNPGRPVVVMDGTSKLKNELAAGLQASTPDHVLILVGECPHSWLFPKMDWLVCHGGIGTTTLALRSRLPTIIVPCVADQEATMLDLYDRGLTVRMPAAIKVTAAMLEVGVTILLRDHSAAWADAPEAEDVDYGAIEHFITKHSATGRYEGFDG